MNRVRSCIFAYHSLDATGSVISIAPELFRSQMAWLAETRTPIVPLSEIRNTPGAVALTFDDGFRNFFHHAFPVLEQYRFPATVFVIAGYCGGRNDWPSQPRHPLIPTLELMPWSEVEQVAKAGINIGSHTVSHPRMSALSESEVERELSLSRTTIEDRTGRPVDAFAYPYGDYTAAVSRAVQSQFRFACSTELGFVSPSSNPIELPRLDIYYLQHEFWFHGLSKEYGAAYVAARRSLRALKNRLMPAR